MSNKPSIPSWQRAQATPSQSPQDQEPASEQQPESSPAPGAEESTREDGQEVDLQDTPLSEQAAKFLEDPAIRDAPREKKVAFLESKGVKTEDIEALLETQIPQDASPDITEAGERAWSTVRHLSILLGLMSP